MDTNQPANVESTPYRLFIALMMPDAVKREIQHWQAQLQQGLPEQSVRWTRWEQWHLTLKFLGKVDVSRVGDLTEAVRAVCDRHAPLQVSAERVGCFPDLRRPRVVWVGVRDEGHHLAGLANAVEDATAGFTAEEREGKFIGHITLARIKNLKRHQSETLAKLVHIMAERVFGAWTADTVEIMRSELAAGGAKHTCLARLPLMKNT